MGEFEVDPPTLRDAAERLSSAQRTAAATDHPAEIRRIDPALPGSSSAAAANRCATAWERSREDSVEAARRHGTALVATADAYETSDAEAAGSAWELIERM